MMGRTVTAVFDGEGFRPTEPLDLLPNTAYRLTIVEFDSSPSVDEFPLQKYLKLASASASRISPTSTTTMPVVRRSNEPTAAIRRLRLLACPGT